METQIVAVERVNEYVELQEEGPYDVPSKKYVEIHNRIMCA